MKNATARVTLWVTRGIFVLLVVLIFFLQAILDWYCTFRTLTESEQIRYLIEHEYVDTVDVAKAILADPDFANGVIEGKEYVKCFGCQPCQYGPFTAHKCPAEMKRMKACQ